VISLVKNLYLSKRFFIIGGSVVAVFTFSFAIPALLLIAKTLFIAFFLSFFFDVFILFNKSVKINCHRIAPKLMSLGDENGITLFVENKSRVAFDISVVDEIPFQFQKRDFNMKFRLQDNEKKMLSYNLRPVTRGEYIFGNINVYFTSVMGLAQRRNTYEQNSKVPVYPSLIQMKKMELKAFSKISNFAGVKKIRRLGHSYEFEQIKNYVRGDDYRSINWKATSRKADLMVNQYEDERAQQIYSIIDNSRSMRMPFENLSLLDYAVNTSLVISNIALHKQDKAGLITFSNKVDVLLKAERSRSQLRKILDSLYRQKEKNQEANFELLYITVRNFVNGRSLLFLYTNFESIYSMERVLPVLRKLNKLHLLVVVFFENTEIMDYGNQHAESLKDIYFHTIAQKFASEKNQIVQQLRQYGIQAILTPPKELSINSVNKYLELKARGMI
jgi:uncharacterized protein (DUF58 family)